MSTSQTSEQIADPAPENTETSSPLNLLGDESAGGCCGGSSCCAAPGE
ncbi:hypothetical protein [Microbacterium sp.]|nr:hypothetical protein [Microbacterium sp.]